MQQRLKLRALLYPCIIVSILIVVVLSLTLCLRNGELPARIVNSRIVKGIAGRFGIQYSIGSLRIGCFLKDCRAQVDVTGIRLILEGPINIDIDNVRWCPAQPVTLRAVKVAGETNVRIGTIEFDPETRNAVIQEVQVTTESGSSATVQRISTSPLRVSTDRTGLALDSIDVTGVKARIVNPSPSPNICRQTRLLLGASQNLAARIAASFDKINRNLDALHRSLLYVAIIVPVILFVMKLWSTAWTNRWRTRLLLGLAGIFVPLSVYGLIGSSLVFARMLTVAFASSLALAILLWFCIYRRAPHRYQRWEPFSIDALSFIIVLPIAAYVFNAGTPFRPPSSVNIGQVNVADTSVYGSLEQCGVTRPFVIGLNKASVHGIDLGLPVKGLDDSIVRIASVEIPGVAVNVQDLQIPEASASIHDVQLRLDWKNQRIQDLAAQLKMKATASATPKPITIAVDVRATGAREQLAVGDDLYRFEDSDATVSLRGVLALNSDDCNLRYSWSARVVRDRLRIVTAGLGDTKSIDVKAIRTLPGSTVQIAGGSGKVSLTNDIAATLRVLGIKTPLGASSVQLDRTDIAAVVGPSCKPTHQSADIGIAGAQVNVADGSIARLENTRIGFNRRSAGGTNPTSMFADVRNATFTSSTIKASLASVRFDLAGTTTSEQLPQGFDGMLKFSLGSPSEPFLLNSTALRLTANLRDGSVNIPLQQQIIHQSIAAQLPNDIHLALGVSGRLREGVRAHVEVPDLAVDLGSAQTRLRDLRIDANTRDETLNYQTGWNSLELPGFPNVFCLDRITEFDLTTEGTTNGFQLPATNSIQSRSGLGRCVNAPQLPTQRSFRVQGTWPALRLEDSTGFGLQVRDVGNSRIQKVDWDNGRLKSLVLDSAATGIQTLQGNGTLGLKSHVVLLDGSSNISSVLSGSGDVSLADVALSGLPDQPTVDVIPHRNGNELFDAFKPFLSSAGFHLNGITPSARIDRVHAGLRFQDRELRSLTAKIDIGAGPLVSIDFTSGESAVRRLDLALKPAADATVRNSIQVALDRSALEMRADLSRVSAHAEDVKGGGVDATMALHTVVNGALSTRAAAPAPILDTLSNTIDDLRRHFASAIRTLTSPALSGPSAPTDLAWSVRIRNPIPNEALLRLAGDNIGIRVASNITRLSWRSGSSEESSVTGLAEFSGDLTLHDDQLVLDANVPLQLRGALGSTLPQRIDLNLPVLVAFSKQLHPAGSSSAGSWDSDYYERFWSTYRVRESSRGDANLFDSARLAAGPVSVQQILLPLEPLRIAIGHGDRFEVDVPFSGRTLFGGAAGLLQGAITWHEDEASIDSRVHVALKNIQAGAIGLDSAYGHVPFVEDELDGDISVRTDGLPINRAMLDPGFDFSSSSIWDALSLHVDLHKSERSMALPGALQLSTDTQVNTLNRVLNRVIRDLQLAVPPQRMSYRNFLLDFRVDRGKVATELPWLKLEGLRVFSTNNVELDGNIRLRGGETARHSNCATCSGRLSVNRAAVAGLLLAAVLIAGCGSQRKSTVGLDVDVYLHPTSSDPADILLQTGIAKRLAEDSVTKTGIIHVRVASGIVILSGAVKSDAIKNKAQQIAQETDIRLNGTPILPDRKINNQIEVQQ